MFTVLLVLQGIICLSLIVLVIFHQGKGADAGAAFGSGGGAHSFFGAAGAADFMTRLTTGVAIAFMACSILLIRAYPRAVSGTGAGMIADPVQGSRLLADAPVVADGEFVAQDGTGETSALNKVEASSETPIAAVELPAVEPAPAGSIAGGVVSDESPAEQSAAAQ
jgi:preprotein translocase subunit SecG